MGKNITISGASDLCDVSRSTIWRWIKSGKLKASKTVGGHHRIAEQDFFQFMSDQKMHTQYRDEISKKILVVDDDYLIQKYLKKLLKSHDFLIEFAKDGFDAGIKTIQFKPHLIILDLFMPKMDGFSACKQIKNSKLTPPPIIIGISGFDTPKNRERILSAGADVFLPKPIDAKNMLEKIKKLLHFKSLNTN